MKKTKIIAGLGVVAGLGVAIAPLASYAVDITSITDTIKITVGSSCSFTTDGGASTTSYPNAEGTIYVGSVANGAVWETGGAETPVDRALHVKCNANSGWNVTALPTNLVGTANNGTIAYGAAISSGDAGQWNAAVTADGANAVSPSAATSTRIAYGSAATAGQPISVKYHVYVGTATPADTYVGSITYTLSTGTGA